jgi:hypothetical protein
MISQLRSLLFGDGVMRRKILGLALFASLFASVPSFAQNELFVAVPETATALARQQRGILEQFRKSRTAAAVHVVTINANLLRGALREASSRSVSLNFSPDKVFAAVATKIDQRSENDFTWHGDVPGKPGSVTLVVKGDNITGSATIANEIYAIEPLGSGLHAIIRKDPATFPPEHPPEFEQLERSRKSFQQRNDIQRDDSGQVIRVLVAYTPAVTAAHGDMDSFIQLAIDETNTSYQNSQIAPRLELATTHQVDYAESGDYDTDLSRFRENNDGFMEEIHVLRGAHAADVAVLIFNNDAFCGLASDIMADANGAFAVVHHDCAAGYYSFGHEIGHLQGARHNPQADPNTTPFTYGHGYYNAGGHWRTVMSYNCSGGCTRVPQWSNPHVNYQGAATGTAQTHNNARVLNETARTVANFRTGPPQHVRHLADINNDGNADIVGFGDAGVWTALSTGDGGFAAERFVLANFGYNQGWDPMKHVRVLADINNDDRPDIVGFGDAGVWTALSTGDGGFAAERFVRANFGYNQAWRVDQHARHLADINNDGNADIVGFGDAGVWTALSTRDGGFAPERFVLGNFGANQSWKSLKHARLVADINNDGSADLVGFGDAGVWTALSTGDGGFVAEKFVLANFGANQTWESWKHPRLLAGNDGKADITGFGDAGVWTALSAGDGGFAPEKFVLANFGHNQAWRVDQHVRLLADINGDINKQADIVGFGDAGVWTALSMADGFAAEKFVLANFGQNQAWRVDKHVRLLADINNDDRADVVGFGDAGVWTALATGDGGFAPEKFVLANFGYNQGWQADTLAIFGNR